MARVTRLVFKLLTFLTTIVVLVYLVYLDDRYEAHLSNHRKNWIPIKRARRSDEDQCMIFLRDRNGRLGNRLFMFATAVGLALTHSCYLHINEEIIEELNQSFTLNLDRLPILFGLNGSEGERKVYNHCSYLTNLFETNTSQSIELTGFWQVHSYFANHTTEIRRQLHFQSSILHQVKTVFENISVARTRVGVHIRRGDFLELRSVSSERYILAAMSYFTRKYSSVVFVIITDDRPYCERMFARRTDVIFTPVAFDAVMDLATFTRCDHAIITVGTFGWWGAYLLHDRRGEVVADAKMDRSPVDVQCDGNFYFPPWFSSLTRKCYVRCFAFR